MIISDLNYLEAANEVKVVGGRRRNNSVKLTVKYATIDQYAENTAVALFGGEAEASSKQTATINQ